MNWCPISFPVLSRAIVPSINALMSLDKPIELASGDATYSIRPFAAPGSRDTCISLCIETGGAAMEVHLSPATLEAVLMDLLSRQAFEALDQDLKLAVLETALAEPFSTLTRYLKAPLSLVGITAIGESSSQTRSHQQGSARTDIDETSEPIGTPGNTPHSVCFEIRRQKDAACFFVHLDLTSELPEPVRSTLNDAGACRRRDFSFLPVPVVFELGAATLSGAAVQSLEPGDIVLFDQCYIGESKLRVNIGERMFLLGDVTGLDLTIAGPEIGGTVAQ